MRVLALFGISLAVLLSPQPGIAFEAIQPMDRVLHVNPPMFEWEASMNAAVASYQIALRRNGPPRFPADVVDTVADTTWTPPDPLDYTVEHTRRATYFWSVRALDAAGGVVESFGPVRFDLDWEGALNPYLKGFHTNWYELQWGDRVEDEAAYRVELARSTNGAGMQSFIIWTSNSVPTGRNDVGPEPYGGTPVCCGRQTEILQNRRDQTWFYRLQTIVTNNGPQEELGPPSDWVRIPRIEERDNLRLFFNERGDEGVQDAFFPTNKTPAGNNEYAFFLAEYVDGLLRLFETNGFRPPKDSDRTGDKFALNFHRSGNVRDIPRMGHIHGPFHGPDLVPFGKGNSLRFFFTTVASAWQHSPEFNQRRVDTIIEEIFHLIQNSYGGSAKGTPWFSEGTAVAARDAVSITVTGQMVSVDLWARANYRYHANRYLGRHHRLSLDDPDYSMAYATTLFWKYLTEQYGAVQGDPFTGFDYVLRLMEISEANGRTLDPFQGIGRTIKDYTGSNDSDMDVFREAFHSFAEALYVAEIESPADPWAETPSKWIVRDIIEAPHLSDPLWTETAFTNDLNLFALRGEVSMPPWSLRYLEVIPPTNVTEIPFNIEVMNAARPYMSAMLVYTSVSARTFIRQMRTGVGVDENGTYRFSGLLPTTRDDPDPDRVGYLDRMGVVVVAHDEVTDFRYRFGGGPSMDIVYPNQQLIAMVGPFDEPRKFVLKLDVRDADGDAMAVDPADITLDIDGEALDPDTIVASSHVGGQTWLVVATPTNDADGSVSLTVTLGSGADPLSVTENNAIRYSDHVIDSILTIDRSGSMTNPASKIAIAKEVGALYLDSYSTNDMVGLQSFNHNVSNLHDLALYAPTNRDEALQSLEDLLTPDGNTAIGYALSNATIQLADLGIPSHQESIVLISDGRNTTGPDVFEYFEEVWKDQEDNRRPRVHSIAIGPDANRPDLERVSGITGGRFLFVPEPAQGGLGIGSAPDPNDYRRDLAEALRVAYDINAGLQQVLSERGTATSDTFTAHSIHVDQNAAELSVSISWDEGVSTVFLWDPMTNAYTTADALWSNDLHYTFHFDAPMPGEWKILNAIPKFCEPYCSVDYLVEAAVRSSLTLHLQIGGEGTNRFTGEAVPIMGILSGDAPVTGATVQGYVISPSNTTYDITLYDDGAHSDGLEGDGVYGHVFTATAESGTYRMAVAATGSTATLGTYVRRDVAAFTIQDGGSGDGDCMPDTYEEQYGLDTNVDDGAEDPDMDGLNNCEEALHGTHPFRDDTDGDGDSDGCEVATGSNPLDRQDGSLLKPQLRGDAGNGHVYVLHAWPSNVSHYCIYRSNDTGTPVTIYETNYVPALASERGYVYVDSNVVNDTTYTYRFKAVGTNSSCSALSRPVQITPSRFPMRPVGSLLVVDDAESDDTSETLLHIETHEHDYPLGFPQDIEHSIPVHEPPGITDMMLSNHDDFDGAAWEPYASIRPWRVVEDEDGLGRVHLLLRDADGNVSYPIEGSILLDEDRYTPGSISGVKWRDVDADRMKDTLEPLLDGFIIYIDLDRDGRLDPGDPRTVTSGGGKYVFYNVPPGVYHVRELERPNWMQMWPGDTLPDYHEIAVTSGSTHADYNFGNLSIGGDPGSISGTLWEDTDQNGVQDGGENPLSSCLVFIDINTNGLLDDGELTTTTDASGFYQFDNLGVGDYRVRQGHAEPWQVTYPTAPTNWHDVFVNSGSSETNKDFGLYIPGGYFGSVDGYLWDDANRNEDYDADEGPLQGLPVFADYNEDGIWDGGEPGDVTDSNGYYEISGLSPRHLVIDTLPDPGWSMSYPPSGSHDFHLLPLEKKSFVNFGLYITTGTLMGVVFVDTNKNALLDAGEEGVKNAQVFLDMDQSGTISTGDVETTTDGNGQYAFYGLPPAPYFVRIQPPDQVRLITPSNGLHAVNLGGGHVLTSLHFAVDRACTQLVATADTFVDSINVSSNAGSNTSFVVGLDYSDAYTRGFIRFDLSTWTNAAEVGQALLRIDQGLALGGDPTTLLVHRVDGAWDEHTLVWSNQPPLSNMMVHAVFDAIGPTSGYHIDITDLVKEWISSGTNNGLALVDQTEYGTMPILATGREFFSREEDPTNGLPPALILCTVGAGNMAGKVEGRVFYDDNGNGVFDGFDSGAQDWIIWSDRDDNSAISAGEPSAVSDMDGFYTLDGLMPGAHALRAQPSFDNPPFYPTVRSIVVTNNACITNQNIMILNTYSIQTRHFEDMNADGTNAGDPDLAGALVFVDENSNGIWDSDEPSGLSDTNGVRDFADLIMGSYIVHSVMGTNFTNTVGLPIPVDLSSSNNPVSLDIGYFEHAKLSGTVFSDLNTNGIRDLDEPGVGHIALYLDRNTNFMPDADEPATIADPSGAFCFGNLGPDTYRLVEVISNGWLRTTDDYTNQVPTSGQDLGDRNIGFYIITTNDLDTDLDGILDALENNGGFFGGILLPGTDPNDSDSDDDGVPDGIEIYNLRTNPHMPDSDGDGQDDGDEWIAGFVPTVATSYFHLVRTYFENGNLCIETEKKDGRTYTLQTRDGFDGPWFDFIELPASSTNLFEQYLPTNDVPFRQYRLKVRKD